MVDMDIKDNKNICESFYEILEIEEKRKKLAKEKRLNDLRELYKTPISEFPNMNTPEKWDFFSGRCFEYKDAVTRNRIIATVDLLSDGKKVLDFGCGYCYVLKEAQRRGLSLDYTGIDISKKFIEKLKEEYPQYRFYCGDLSSVSGQKFDYILLLEVLEHIQPSQTVNFLEKVNSFLNNEGKLIVSVPVFENLIHSLAPCWVCGSLGSINGHIRSYTPELIQAELELAGYRIESSHLIYWSRFLFRRFLSKLKQILLGGAKYQPFNIVIAARTSKGNNITKGNGL